MTSINVIFYYKNQQGKIQSTLEEADPDESLSEVFERTNVLSELGADSIKVTKFICKGKIRNPFLTISHELIASQSEKTPMKVFLFYSKPAPVKKSKKQEFLEKLSRSSKINNIDSSDRELQKLKSKEERERQNMEEILRINDQIWSTWETSQDHNQIVQMMYEIQEEKFNEQKEEFNNSIEKASTPLNLSTATEISCDPLPNCFSHQTLGKHQILVSHCH